MGVTTANGPLPLVGEIVIVLAHDLTPSETAQLDPNMVHAFATESGGPTSHTAIMEVLFPRSLGSDVSDRCLRRRHRDCGYWHARAYSLSIRTGDLARYANSARPNARRAGQVEPLQDVPSVTRDGVRDRSWGTSSSRARPGAHCLERGAEGVGLYQTEFLYINKTTDPSESEHFDAYKSVLTTLGPSTPSSSAPSMSGRISSRPFQGCCQ